MNIFPPSWHPPTQWVGAHWVGDYPRGKVKMGAGVGRNAMVDQNNPKDELNRRDILRAVGGTGATMVGFTGATSATAHNSKDVGITSNSLLRNANEEEKRVYQKYTDDKSMVERAFNKHIESVANMMVSDGISPPSSFNEATDVKIAPDSRDGKASAHIIAKFDNDEKTFLHIYPEVNEAVAHVGSGEEKLLVDPEKDEVVPMGCYKEYQCECPSHCGWYDGFERVYENCTIPGGGTESKLINFYCNCQVDSPRPCKCEEWEENPC